MDPELSTAAAEQNFAWICKQHQDLMGSVLFSGPKLFGPDQNLVWYDDPIYKTIWSGLNLYRTTFRTKIWLYKRYLSVPKIWSGLRSRPKRDLLM